MRKSQIGKCKLCGKTTNLTFEHVPPHKAFNSHSVKKYSGDEATKLITGADGRMPWDFSGLKGEIDQRGSGEYYLCNGCNNNTGSWYMSDYVEFAKTLHSLIVSNKLKTGEAYRFSIKRLKPLRIFKAIMMMFCDINHECFGDEQLRDFLLNKESTEIDLDKYSLYIYLVNPHMRRELPFTAMFINKVGILSLSEVASYPLGATLYINKANTYNPPGVPINEFVRFNYDDTYDVEFSGMPYYEINTLIPADFRTKNEIQETIRKNKEQTNV